MAHVAELSSIMFIDKQGSQNIESGDEDEETEISKCFKCIFLIYIDCIPVT